VGRRKADFKTNNYLVGIGKKFPAVLPVWFFDIVNRFLAFDGSVCFDLSEVPKISIADRLPYQKFLDGDSGSSFSVGVLNIPV
jgi:hypothetical protein